MADASPRTDISTDVDTDDKYQRVSSYCLLDLYLLSRGMKMNADVLYSAS